MSRIATDISALVRAGIVERSARRSDLTSLAGLRNSLQATRATLASALDGAAIGAEAKARAQTSIDAAAANVRALADAPNSRALREAGAPTIPGADGATTPQTFFVVRKFTQGITGATVPQYISTNNPIQATVQVRVTEVAQAAALRLSFGGTALDLSAATARLDIIVAGDRGSQRFLFTSGTALTAIAATINTFSEAIGVNASVSGTTGVRLTSREHGGGEFVSVRIVNSGGSAGAGVVTYNTTNNAATGGAGSTIHAFGSNQAGQGVIDYGVDVRGTIGGVEAWSDGLTLHGWNSPIGISVTLSQQAATTAGYIGGVLLEAIPWQPPFETDSGANDSSPGAAPSPFDAFA